LTHVFFDKPIRVDESGPEPMFVLRDCMEANGIALSSNRANYSRIQDQKGLARFATPGGTQSLVTISEKGFNTLSMRGHKPCSDAFRDWLADVAVQIRKTGRYDVAAPASSYSLPSRSMAAS
jgi:prophage antirepressor-like protein